MNAFERHQRRKHQAIVGSSAVAIVIVLLLIFSLFSSVMGVPIVVEPAYLPDENETFEDDTIGIAPSESWYAYTGEDRKSVV